MARSAGVLLSITSLPSPYGIGTIGKEARKFADFLKKSGQTIGRFSPLDRQATVIHRISLFQPMQAILTSLTLTLFVKKVF